MKKPIAILILLCIILVSCFAPGSYPYAERYNVNLPDLELINRIISFKKTHPIYGKKIQFYKDGRLNQNSHWFRFYFEEKSTKKLFQLLIRNGITNNTSIILFPSVHIPGEGWKRINKDFKSVQNESLIEIVESRIIHQLGIDSLIVK